MRAFPDNAIGFYYRDVRRTLVHAGVFIVWEDKKNNNRLCDFGSFRTDRICELSDVDDCRDTAFGIKLAPFDDLYFCPISHRRWMGDYCVRAEFSVGNGYTNKLEARQFAGLREAYRKRITVSRMRLKKHPKLHYPTNVNEALRTIKLEDNYEAMFMQNPSDRDLVSDYRLGQYQYDWDKEERVRRYFDKSGINPDTYLATKRQYMQRSIIRYISRRLNKVKALTSREIGFFKMMYGASLFNKLKKKGINI